jgi:hypothetical protein
MIKQTFFSIALALTMSTADAQSAVDLTIKQARSVAFQALSAGEPALALQIAEALLAQSPDDRTALMIVASAAPQLGDPEKGRKAGARAWSLSTTDTQKYEAARLTARAAVEAERYTLATFWLRRALTVTPNDNERARTIADARTVTRLNPWGTSLSFSLAPSNNVNGGAADEDFKIEGRDTNFDISDNDLALAGWRATFGLGTQYRLSETQQTRSTVALRYQGARGWFTEDTELPDKSLQTDALTVTLRNEIALENGVAGLTLSAATFRYHSYSASEDDTREEKYDTLGFSIDRRLTLPGDITLSLSAGQERIDFTVGDDRIDRTNLGVGLGFSRANNDRVNLNWRYTNADGSTTRNTSYDNTLQMSYSWAEPIGPISLSTSAGVTFKTYPDFVEFDPSSGFITIDGGRKDRTGFAALNIGFPQIEYAGFSPGMRINASRTDSNISRYDQQSLSASLTINSSF